MNLVIIAGPELTCFDSFIAILMKDITFPAVVLEKYLNALSIQMRFLCNQINVMLIFFLSYY